MYGCIHPSYFSLINVGESDPSKIVKVMANEGKSGEPFEFAYTNCKVIGNGSFGVVFQARFVSNGDDAAIKKVLQDKRFKVQFDSVKSSVLPQTQQPVYDNNSDPQSSAPTMSEGWRKIRRA